jgi:Mg-chelatase subunit ChlD
VLALGCAGNLGPSTGDDDTNRVDGGPGNDDINTTDAEICDEVTPIEITGVPPPDLLMVVDKSGSMAETLGTGEVKWAVMRTALTSIVTEYEGGINFGLLLFPFGSQCTAGIVSSQMGAASTEISTTLTFTIPDGGTPTHTTLQTALQYYNGIPENLQGRYVLLATDGQPNCRDMIDPNVPTVNETITAINNLRSANILTYVLGFGDAVNNDPTTLQAMAEAGGTGNYYACNSPAELQAALDDIAGSLEVPPCTFDLGVVPEDPDKIAVFFDDVAVPRDPAHQNGWDYDPVTNQITIYGMDCDRLQSGSVTEVRVDYGCGGPIVL